LLAALVDDGHELSSAAAHDLIDLTGADSEIAPEPVPGYPHDLPRNVASNAIVPDEHQFDLAIRSPPRLCRPEAQAQARF
jgi:hypothetical protein